MGRIRSQRLSGWRLSPYGWILSVALLVLIVLSIFDPSSGVFGGLAVVIVIWALLLGSSFPSGQARGMAKGTAGRKDWGGEAAERYEREHGED